MTLPVRSRFVPALLVATATLVVTGCSPQAPAPPAVPSAAAQAAANEAAAAKMQKLYQQMLDGHSEMLAAPVGEEIVQKYPGTAAAAEVMRTLPQIQARAKAKAEHNRLADLWWYQTADVQGLQHTASIYETGKPRAEGVRLVLRRHAKWGQSVYLFAPDGSKGFVCKGNCNVGMRFDGKRETWKAYLPETGEPAMFITDDKRFIAAMQKARVIEMDVEMKDQGKRTLKFEVGGFVPDKFLALPTPSSQGAAAINPEQGSQWNYREDKDPMGKGAAYFASVSSTNTVNFGFPYSGPQHGTLTLRTHPRYGKDVILSIERGQFLCTSFEACTVLVRFDDSAASNYSAIGAADNSTETVFIRGYSRFLSRMEKSKRVRISANVYQEGAPVFEFDVSGFDPHKYKPSKQ